MEEWLFLFLPIAAGSGWMAARSFYRKKYLVKHSDTLRQAYCRGLNYLLHERTDEAINAFADLLAKDSETIETHIALGNLFRRRGEMEKSIEIHEALIARENLSPAQRATAYFELGLDYQRAGLFDRAESIFTNLADHETYRKSALQHLLQIYQHEKEWRKAAECTRQLHAINKLPNGETVAQFLCEMAEETLAANRHEEALTYLERALAEDPKCVRASLLIARLRMRDGHFEAALDVLKRVEAQNPHFIPEIVEPLRICYERLDKSAAELLGYLGYLYDTYGLEGPALALAEQLTINRDASRASEHLQRVLESQPALRPLGVLTGLLLKEDLNAQKDALIRIDRAIDRLAAGTPRYRCTLCGFSGMELHWRCPSCRHWESTRPL
jgi:lipopolysaccharide assembly protein B